MAYKPTLVNLTEQQKTALRVKAGQLTSQTGQTVSVNDIIRQAIEHFLDRAADGSVDEITATKGHEIKFVPVPVVNKALRRAAGDTGKPIGDVVNQLLYEAIQSQEVM